MSLAVDYGKNLTLDVIGWHTVQKILVQANSNPKLAYSYISFKISFLVSFELSWMTMFVHYDLQYTFYIIVIQKYAASLKACQSKIAHS